MSLLQPTSLWSPRILWPSVFQYEWFVLAAFHHSLRNVSVSNPLLAGERQTARVSLVSVYGCPEVHPPVIDFRLCLIHGYHLSVLLPQFRNRLPELFNLNAPPDITTPILSSADDPTVPCRKVAFCTDYPDKGILVVIRYCAGVQPSLGTTTTL